ncbi:DUF4123 domain-containing protein [Pseudomonas alkylphenolica]|uniref:DUF4123 domain-containing protein n=1 Tax=Pseudomonas alkylphenolica TaxID=237609 RepID=UPI0018DA041C|nr:DUF4123 domain-containing protein [Pseudomonas alkylphenolica]MBH3428114.1 DUF4123 domain-containing protein [Pseudomonas alkylphenolica]
MSKNHRLAGQWLNEQLSRQRQLILIANPMAEPNPLPTLFAQAPIHDYVKLYQGTDFHSLADLGPWLVRIDASAMPALSMLLQTPQQQWGWVASASRLDMQEVVAHWRARMIVLNDDQRSFYRFHDNRVIARHLQALKQEQIPLLLGPLCSALCWDGEQWRVMNNPQPGSYPEPFETPWLSLLAPESLNAAAHQAHLENWLWANHPQATQQLLPREPLMPWLKAQLDKAQTWRWLTQDQLHFLLEHQLCADLMSHVAWEPRATETPESHFVRVTREVAQAKTGARE